MSKFRPQFAKGFAKDLRRYAGLRRQIQNKVEQVLDDPYRSSELLTIGRWSDLRGKRSVRITKKFRLVFAVCEECLNRGFKDRGFNNCAGCTKTVPDDIVVFLSIGPRDTAYGRL